MLLSHFSQKAVTDIHDVAQPVHGYLSPYEKPKGLWLSIDGDLDWEEWCASEMTDHFNDYKFRYRVNLVRYNNVLHIPRDLGMYGFQSKYGKNVIRDGFDFGRTIEWVRVAQEYDGIIIAPYQWPFRLSMSWYYPWDCASGCIWKARAVKSITQLPKVVSKVVEAASV